MEDCETPRTAASTSLALPYTSARRTFPYKRTPHQRRIAGPKPTSASPVASGRLRRSPASKAAAGPVPLPGLTNKTWQVFHLSPLYGFSTQPQSLKQYGRSLASYLLQDRNKDVVADNGNGKQCALSIYEGVQVNAADPEAVQILVTNKTANGRGAGQVVLTAILCGVDLDSDPCSGLKKHFVYYPIMLVKATVALTSLLSSWLEQFWQVSIDLDVIVSIDLDVIVSIDLGVIVSIDLDVIVSIDLDVIVSIDLDRKSKPVELLYTVPAECEGVSRITYTIDANDCKVLWDSIHTTESEEFTGEEVGAFIKSLEEHFYECFKVKLWKMELSRVGTAVAYIGDGKLKIFSAEDAWQVLRFMSELALEQFQMLTPPSAPRGVASLGSSELCRHAAGAAAVAEAFPWLPVTRSILGVMMRQRQLAQGFAYLAYEDGDSRFYHLPSPSRWT
ncbi:hypothetical protein BaRGS_00033740, partial [Batillaria attramentaria]